MADEFPAHSWGDVGMEGEGQSGAKGEAQVCRPFTGVERKLGLGGKSKSAVWHLESLWSFVMSCG